MSADGGSRCHRKEDDQSGRTRPGRHLLFLLSSVVAAALALSAGASSASALNLGLNWSGSYSEGESAAEMDAIQHSGAKYFRQQISWGYKKEHGWGPYDEVFRLAAERGMTILPYLYGRENGSPQFPEKGEYPAWENWVYEVINRYGYNGDFWVGKSYAKPVDVWEVWNEPNLKKNNPGGTTVQPKLFGSFLKRTSNAIKAAQQARAPGHVGTTVVMGGLMKVVSGIGNIESFLLGVNEETGATASYDALGLHPYEFETPNHITELNDTLSFARWVLNNKVAGASKPIWVTELGWPVEYGEAGKSQQVSEAEQASLLTEAFNLIKAHPEYNIPTAIWYSYHDISVGEWAYHCGLRKVDGTYRPSWYAFEEEAGASKWPVAPTGVFFPDAPNNNSMTRWGWESGKGWQQEFLFGHPVAAGTHPATLMVNGTPNVFFVDASDNNTITDWTWTAGLGWQQTFLYGHSVAKGTSPSAIMLNGRPFVFFVDATNNNSLSYWSLSPSTGWQQTFLYGHPVAAGTSPSAINSNEMGEVFFVDASDNNTITDWKGNLSTAWQQTFLYGHTVAAGSSPSAIFSGGNPGVFFADATNNNSISFWLSLPTLGWQQGFFYGHPVAAGTSPTVVMSENSTHIDFADATNSNSITDWSWNEAQGWHQTFLYGHAVAAGTSPVGVANSGYPDGNLNLFFVDAADSNTITRWRLSPTVGWQQEFFFGHAVTTGSGPGAF